MKILVVNVGTTSLKYKLYEMPDELILAQGYLERVGREHGIVTHSVCEREVISGEPRPLPDFPAAIDLAIKLITDPETGALKNLSDISAFAFKPVALRGLDLEGAVPLDEDVLSRMEASNILAPRHNPPYIEAVRIFRKSFPGIPCLGLFEPAFHSSIPEHARIYGIPYEWTERHFLRGYGYHGASHRYIAETVPGIIGRSKGSGGPAHGLKIINCHLGGSSSICAIQDGKSVDTSMGLSPQSGLIHGTRSGDMDAFAFPLLMREEGLGPDELIEALCTRGGLFGISGVSGDMRDLRRAIQEGNTRARLAKDAFVHGIRKYIGAYVAVLCGLDVLCFTGGIGEHDAELRSEVCTGLEFLGIRIEPSRNQAHDRILSRPDSPVTVMAVATNEELILAREAMRYLESKNRAARS
jgi:acetate kinase